MNSKILKETGFADFIPLKELSLLKMPKNEGHVFVLIDQTLSENPASDILYIGKAKKPAKKILGGYIAGSGGKSVKKIHDKLFNNGLVETISISWMASANPKTTQKELLEKFKSEHGDYPTWNSPPKQAATPKSKPKSAKPVATRKPKSKKIQKPA